ncbi:MAG: CPBP family intramembrane metalloprotease [Anaerolineales bacterium]
MKTYSQRITPKSRSLLLFFLLVFGISSIIWSIGAAIEHLMPELPVNIPFSSLMFVSPIIAGCYCVYRENGSPGVKKLLKRTFDYEKVVGKTWYLATLFLMPIITGIQYGILRLMHRPIPNTQISFSALLVIPIIFFIAAIGEEVGWQGYAIDRLQTKWNALSASILLGIVWAVWHIIPMIQMGQTPVWIMWQCTNIAVTRILMVWIYNNAGKSVFLAVLYHAMYNVCTMLFPGYDPVIVTPTLILLAVAIAIVWGPKTLADYRHSASRKGANSLLSLQLRKS